MKGNRVWCLLQTDHSVLGLEVALWAWHPWAAAQAPYYVGWRSRWSVNTLRASCPVHHRQRVEQGLSMAQWPQAPEMSLPPPLPPDRLTLPHQSPLEPGQLWSEPTAPLSCFRGPEQGSTSPALDCSPWV